MVGSSVASSSIVSDNSVCLCVSVCVVCVIKVRPGAPSSTSGRFDEIPEGIHVLVTHGPSHERLDRVQTYLNTDGSKSQSPLLLKSSSGSTAAAQSVQRKEEHWGSRELADNIRRVRPALHLHGHVKDARGVLAAFAHQPLVRQISTSTPLIASILMISNRLGIALSDSEFRHERSNHQGHVRLPTCGEGHSDLCARGHRGHGRHKLEL